MRFLFFLLSVFFFYTGTTKQGDKIAVFFDEDKTYQTIRNFGASDAWACQFVGSWADEKKNTIADWLFSTDTLSNGNPKGIGLSLWRYNLGAGSAEQGDNSSIKDEWRRAVLVNNHAGEWDELLKAQNWFLFAAKQRGTQQFLGFFNSPPVQLTVNGKAHATGGKCNIDFRNYNAFANYAVDAIKSIEQSTGITFDYISPVNEPQWDWSDDKQEGCPYNNDQVSDVVKSFSHAFLKNKIDSKILITESGQLDFLLPHSNKNKGNQVDDFFSPASKNCVGNLPNVSKTIASHSYFSTSPFDKAMALRKQVKESIAHIKNLELWQSEYCILGNNDGEIEGNERDLGMEAALYVAKVMYEDLTGANVSAWQWWLAISPYDYKDGLIYIDKNKTGGNFHDSKMLWAMGNYSYFIRPGMKRIDVDATSKDLLVSGYKNDRNNRLVLVFVNAHADEKKVKINGKKSNPVKNMLVYITDVTRKLEKNGIQSNELVIPAKSVVTVLIDY